MHHFRRNFERIIILTIIPSCIAQQELNDKNIKAKAYPGVRSRMSDYTAIGKEVHVNLVTKSKVVEGKVKSLIQLFLGLAHVARQIKLALIKTRIVKFRKLC